MIDRDSDLWLADATDLDTQELLALQEEAREYMWALYRHLPTIPLSVVEGGRREMQLLPFLPIALSDEVVADKSSDDIIDSDEAMVIIAETIRECMNVVPPLYSATREPSVTRARHMGYYLARKYTDLSFTALGKFFQRDHTTVISGVRTVQSKLDKGDELWERDLGKVEGVLLEKLQVEPNGTIYSSTTRKTFVVGLSKFGLVKFGVMSANQKARALLQLPGQYCLDGNCTEEGGELWQKYGTDLLVLLRGLVEGVQDNPGLEMSQQILEATLKE